VFRRNQHDRAILALAVPAFGALVAEPLYVLTDTAIVGHLGTEELAGLAIAAAVLLSAHAAMIFLAYGTTSIVGRLLGAGNQHQAAVQGVQALWLALALGIAVAGLLGVTSGPIVDLFGPVPEVRTHALTYLRVSLIGVPGMLLVLAGTGYLRGLQDTRTPLLVAVVSAVANLVIELVLVFALDWGIAGSAWSTVIVQLGSGAVYAWSISGHARQLGASLRPHISSLATYARVGAQLFVRTAALRGSLVIAAAIAARLGTIDVAAHQIGMEVWSLLALALDAVAIAGQALVAQELGASRVEQAREASRRMIGMSVQAGLLFAVVLLAGRTWFPLVFSDDPAVTELAAFVLLFVAMMQPLNAVVFALDGILIGAGDLRFLAQAMVVAFAVFVALAVGVWATGAGMGWLWAAIVGLMVARMLPLWHRFRTERWIVVGAPTNS
jgi:putative MATE family efflux protein